MLALLVLIGENASSGREPSRAAPIRRPDHSRMSLKLARCKAFRECHGSLEPAARAVGASRFEIPAPGARLTRDAFGCKTTRDHWNPVAE
jgi:hypothetical protein